MPSPFSALGEIFVLLIAVTLALVVVAFRHRRTNVATAHLRGRSLSTAREAQALLDQNFSAGRGTS